MKPSIGRIVIYCRNGMEIAAVITSVCNPELQTVNLEVFPPAMAKSYFPQTSLEWIEPKSERAQIEYWKWPERV